MDRSRHDAPFTRVVTPVSHKVPSLLTHAKAVPTAYYSPERNSLGRTVATQWIDFCFEESPGSMDTLPGNAWAPVTR